MESNENSNKSFGHSVQCTNCGNALDPLNQEDNLGLCKNCRGNNTRQPLVYSSFSGCKNLDELIKIATYEIKEYLSNR